MTKKSFAILILLAAFACVVLGCENNPTRTIDTSKMSTEEKQKRQDKEGN